MFFSILNLLMLIALSIALVCAYRYWALKGTDNEKELLLFAMVAAGSISSAYVLILGFSAAVAELTSTLRAAYSFIFRT